MSLEQKEWFKEWKRGYTSAFEDKLSEKQAELDALQAKLDIAVEALKYYQSSDGTIESIIFSTKIANEALKKLEEK